MQVDFEYDETTRKNKIEWTLDLHETRITGLEHREVITADTLGKIANSLVQIKYFIVGSIFMFMVSELGVLETIKQLL